MKDIRHIVQQLIDLNDRILRASAGVHEPAILADILREQKKTNELLAQYLAMTAGRGRRNAKE